MAVIDIPVGLTDAQSAPRATDAAARGYAPGDEHRMAILRLGRACFPAPSREALALFRARLDFHALNARLAGPKISQQAFHITERISDVDAWMTPDRQRTRREGHPEVAFARLTGRTLPPKKTRAGAGARDVALGRLGFDVVGAGRHLGKAIGPLGDG